jgi:hypothetical protein
MSPPMQRRLGADLPLQGFMNSLGIPLFLKFQQVLFPLKGYQSHLRPILARECGGPGSPGAHWSGPVFGRMAS